MIYSVKSKIWISICLSMLTNTIFGQDKYQSLLWEIKSPELEEPSYLYGTMHVSSKLAFHLTDDFFENLEKVDIVALESDPTQWLSETEQLDDEPMLNTRRFYRQFQHKVLDKYSLAEQLATDHAMINSLLYRSNSAMQDFQEDTYLDMFIFQSGSRFNKPILGLEDFKESRDLVREAYSKEVVKSTPPVWLQDLMKEKNYEMILSDSYRNNDLDMIDSLNSGLNTDHYLEYMLYKRNENMVEVYDSIIKTGNTIFAGVGAAHLPGPQGMIEAFRNKGYQVTPVYGEMTEKGKKAKARIEEKRVKREFKPFKSSDGFIEFLSPANVHEVSFYGKTMYLAPDLTNGSYVAVSRMKLNHFANTKEEDNLSFEDIDKILIEYIPGEIESKIEIERNGISGLDLVSKTKRGDYHRYNIFKTPLEFIVIKMIGKNDDVKGYGDELFNSIAFNYKHELTDVEPLQGGFSVRIPGFYLLDNNNVFTSKTGNPELQAFDKNTEAYYFVKQLVLNDNTFLEKDEFELNRILDVYFKSVKIDSFTLEKDVYLNRLRQIGFGTLKDGEPLALSAMIKGGHYYVMGSKGMTKQEAMRFFNSFSYTKMKYKIPFKEVIDTNLNYKVMAPQKADVDGDKRNAYATEDKKPFESVTQKQVFNAISKQQVFLKYHKYNTYAQYENIDSLWQAILDYKINQGQVVEYKHKGVNTQNDPYLDIVMADTATARKLKFKYIIHGGIQYKLSTVIDSLAQNDDAFVNSIFNTFQPLDTTIGVSPIEPKAELFFTHLNSGVDSLAEQALDNYYEVLFFKEDKNQLINTIENWAFEDEDLNVKMGLITDYSKLHTEDRLTYLTKWYTQFEDNADMQIHILNQFSKDGSKQAYKQIGKLLESDIPLPYKKYKVSQMFTKLDKHPELEKEIVDNLMSLLGINEYKTSVLETISNLYDKEIIGKHFLKKHKKQLISLAKVELKRARSQQIANSKSSNSSSDYDELNNLLHVLLPFRNDDEVKSIYEKIKSSDFKEEHTQVLAYELKLKDKVDQEEILRLAKDIDTRAFMYSKFSELEITDLYPQEYALIDSISESFLSNEYLKKDEDYLEFYTKRNLIKEGDDYIAMYYKFFTTNYQKEKKTKLVYAIFKTDDISKPAKTDKISEDFRDDNLKTLKEEEERFKLENHPRVVFTNGGMYNMW